MIDADFLRQLSRFSLIIRKRVTSNYSGARKSVAKGKGIILKEHRIYTPGDDYRSIDWRIYARTDDLYIKQYEEERSLVVHTIVDATASMDFGEPVKKFDYAAMIAVGFAHLAVKENEKIRFATFSKNLEFFRSKRGMGQLISMIEYLNEFKPAGKGEFLTVMQYYKKTIKSKSLIVLISDFLYPPEEIEQGLIMLRKHDLKVIQVLDKSERKLDMVGDFRLFDSETADKMRTYISPRLVTEYQHHIDAHIARLKDMCDRIGIKFQCVTTNTPIFDTFYRILS